MIKSKEEEEQYCLNGWEDKEQSELYGAVYLRRLQQKIQQANQKLSESAKLPYRAHLKKKSKELIPNKVNDISHLKKDRELLQQYLGNRSEAETQRTYVKDSLSSCKAKTIACAVVQTHQKHRSSEIDLRFAKCAQVEETNVSVRQFLFCGKKKEKKRRRKYLVKINKLQQPAQKNNKADPARKRFIMSEKGNIEKDREELRIGEERVIKKGLKFPLFYREVNSKQRNSISKNVNLMSLHKKQKFGELNSTQFTDDNIFQAKFIRV